MGFRLATHILVAESQHHTISIEHCRYKIDDGPHYYKQPHNIKATTFRKDLSFCLFLYEYINKHQIWVWHEVESVMNCG